MASTPASHDGVASELEAPLLLFFALDDMLGILSTPYHIS
jgi:hypothetical protein